MHKRLLYKLSTDEQPDKWLVVEFIRSVDDKNKIFIVREMHGWTLDDFRTTTDHVTMALVEVELDKKAHVPEPTPTPET
jgi:hypothetical protein